MAEKEVEVTNTAGSPRTVINAAGKPIVVMPGQTTKVNVSEEMAKRIGERAEKGAKLVIGKPKETGKAKEQSAQQSQQAKA